MALLSEAMVARSCIGPSLVALVLACNPDPDGSGSGSGSGASSGASSGGSSDASSDASSESSAASSDASSGATADSESGDGETATDTAGAVIECPIVNRTYYSGTGKWTQGLNTPEDVEKLVGCTHVSDSLIISGGEIVDLTPLASLRHISGTLSIYGSSNSPQEPGGPPSLAGLEGLELVDGLHLEALRITDLVPLAGLSDIPGEVRVTRNWALGSLEGLHNLATVGEALVVDDCPQLQDLNGLRGLQRVGVRIFFGDLPITSLKGLEALTEVGMPGGESRIGLYNLDKLTSLDALAIDWRPEHDLWIYRTAISDLNIFAGVDELTALNLDGNDMLTTLSGLESLAVVRNELRLGNNEKVTDLGALASLEALGALTLERSSFTDLGPLPALQQPGDLRISGNGQLASLSSLTGATTLRSLVLESNPMLAVLPELTALAQVEGDLELRDNAIMTNLSDLVAVASVGGRLAVVGNPELLQTDAETWAAPIVVGGARKIVSNKGYDQPPFDPCPWAGDGECDVNVCVEDEMDCLSD